MLYLKCDYPNIINRVGYYEKLGEFNNINIIF